MGDSVRAFYDEIAPEYHRIYADWDVSVRRQRAILHGVIARELGVGARAVLDAACGIGTQAIGLALHGHRVTGTDLSPASVERAATEAARFGVAVTTGTIDMRHLSPGDVGTFDVVIACDNALPHLLSDDDLRLALGAMTDCLVPGGLLLASVRDYAALRESRPHAELPRVVDGPDGRRVTMQLWDWADDGRTYQLSQFLLTNAGGTWAVRHAETVYRALGRVELAEAMTSVGLSHVRWHEPEASGFHQPIVMGRRGEPSE